MKHGVGRNGKKLSTALIEKMSKEDKDDQQESVQNESDESTEVKSTNPENFSSEKSDDKNVCEDTSGNAIDNTQVSKENVSSSAWSWSLHQLGCNK